VRIALISDLHGNGVALDAVLADVRRRGADQIVCLGDTATLGPHPREVLARLRDLRCPCIVGNHDAFMLEPELVHGYTDVPIVVDAVEWCRARLGADDFAFLATFVPTLAIPLEGGARLFLFHGTPRSHTEDLLATTPPDEVDAMLAGHTAAVMAGGHTHIQMLRQHKGTLIVNPGSVGLPFQQYVGGREPTLLAHAEWGCIEANAAGVSVTLHRVPLERAALRAAAAATDNPIGRALAAQYA
jgi:predicted phosphodiesterase